MRQNIMLATAICGAIGTLASALSAYARRVGGLTFVKLGRLSFSFCITKQ